MSVTLLDIIKAKKLIAEFVRETPLEKSSYYSSLSGAEVHFKLENFQITGSFKVRGALNKILPLSDEIFDRGVITVSAGNHAVGFALACEKRGREGLIVMPETVSIAKKSSAEKYKCPIELHGRTYDEAEDITFEMVKDRKAEFVSPYDDPAIVAGAGTVGLEIAESLADVDVCLVPAGGGGLIAGVATALKTINPDILIFGIQSEASPVHKVSLDAGRIVECDIQDSIAEGLHGRIAPGAMTFPIIKELVEDVLLVSEDEIKAEFVHYVQNQRQILEASSIVVPAAIRRHKVLFTGKKVVGVISGANIEANLLARLIQGE